MRLPVPARWTVERMVPGGDGFLRVDDGRAAFVPGGFPGDVFEVREFEDHGDWVRARAPVLASPSPDRVAPPCPHASACGGCDWMALARPAQLRSKQDVIRDALRRTAGMGDVVVEPVVTAGPDLRYRSRVRLHVSGGRLGYFRPGSRTLVHVDSCVVADPAVDRALAALRGAGEALAAVDTVSIRTDDGGQVVAVARPGAGGGPSYSARAGLRAIARARGFTLEFADEPPGAVQRLAVSDGVSVLAAGDAFTQVNRAVNRVLVAELVRRLREAGARTFLDLFAGSGNFTLPLLGAGLRGVAVEAHPAAIGLARRAAAEAGLADGRFVEGDATRVAEELAVAGERFDAVVLDPPRTGARDALPAVERLTSRVAYVACDAVTFARDAADLRASGLRLVSVTPYDMFPHTHHVELLGWFER